MDNLPSPAQLPAQKHTGLLGSAPRRRPVLLFCLLVGLTAFLIWLPGQARTALWSALSVQRRLVSLLFFFTLMALSLVWSVGQRLDSAVFLFLNLRGAHPVWLDRTMWMTTQLGSMPVAFGAACFFFVQQYRSLAVELILGTTTLWLVVETLKLLTDRARPFLALEGTRIIGRRESGRSFPSGHTSQVFFMMALLTRELRLDFWPGLSLYAVAALVGFTRVYVGAHYPRDVVGGAMLGSAWAVVAILINPFLSIPRF